MPESLLLSLVSGLFVVLVVPVGGWLVNRTIKTVDASLASIHADIRSMHAVVTGLSERSIELQVRVANLEREQAHLAQLYSDLAGFLHSQGFRKRGDPP